MIIPYQHRGPGTPYNAFGELRGPGRTQEEIRADLAERAEIAARNKETRVVDLAPAMGAVAATEAMQVAEQTPTEHVARLGGAAVLGANAEVA